ncbi:hypothetical protein HDU91_003795 [Kappamyces sp. JEL0680]|nr:hypothetical protein HDU91_003795 [Kappamyces sp. JEL0680]
MGAGRPSTKNPGRIINVQALSQLKKRSESKKAEDCKPNDVPPHPEPPPALCSEQAVPAVDSTQEHSGENQENQATTHQPVKCKNCRNLLFSAIGRLSHTPSQKGQKSFDFRKRNLVLDPANRNPCHHLFLSLDSLVEYCHHPNGAPDPEREYHQTLLHQIQDQEVGKIPCQHCECKIGTFNLSGAQCSCGVSMSKVDVSFFHQ